MKECADGISIAIINWPKTNVINNCLCKMRPNHQQNINKNIHNERTNKRAIEFIQCTNKLFELHMFLLCVNAFLSAFFIINSSMIVFLS